MTHIVTQVLIYEKHEDELQTIADTLEVLKNDFSEEACALKRRLVIRHDQLIMSQQPKLQDYNEYLRSRQ
jgi:hypothetical protein